MGSVPVHVHVGVLTVPGYVFDGVVVELRDVAYHLRNLGPLRVIFHASRAVFEAAVCVSYAIHVRV